MLLNENGLKGAELIIYNALLQFDLSYPISARQIADVTYYSTRTIWQVLTRLEQDRLIERQRKARGQAYRYSIKEQFQKG